MAEVAEVNKVGQPRPKRNVFSKIFFQCEEAWTNQQ